MFKEYLVMCPAIKVFSCQLVLTIRYKQQFKICVGIKIEQHRNVLADLGSEYCLSFGHNAVLRMPPPTQSFLLGQIGMIASLDQVAVQFSAYQRPGFRRNQKLSKHSELQFLSDS